MTHAPLLLLLALNAAEPTDADCALNPASLTGVFVSAGVEEHQVKREDRRLKESGTIDGRQVSYDVGGCAHYAFTLRFVLTEADETEYLVALAKRLVASLPLTADARTSMAPAVTDALAAAKGDVRMLRGGATITLPLKCGDATCEVRGGARELSFTYDFPL